MPFHSSDQDLLLLAHDALPAPQKLIVQIHIVLCADCRARLTKLEEASFQTAAVLRGPDLPAWTAPNSDGTLRAARTAAEWFAVLAVLLILSILLISTRLPVRFSTHRSQKQLSPGADGGCRPDLASDKCR